MEANTGTTKRGLLLTGGAALLHLKYDGAPATMERTPVLLGVNSSYSRGMSAHAGKLREESKQRLPRLTAIWSFAWGNQRDTFGSVPPRAGFRTSKGERNSRANPEEWQNGGRRVGSVAAAPPRYRAGARLPVCAPMREAWWRLAA
ncbi:Tbingi protein [Trypanosoma cruzi]|nr:Tbingi protein [Trypanosoma cruzi]